MGRYTFLHSELHHNDVPLGYRFVRLGLKGNLLGWYKMGRYRGQLSQWDTFGGHTFWKPGNSLCAKVRGVMSCYNKLSRASLV